MVLQSPVNGVQLLPASSVVVAVAAEAGLVGITVYLPRQGVIAGVDSTVPFSVPISLPATIGPLDIVVLGERADGTTDDQTVTVLLTGDPLQTLSVTPASLVANFGGEQFRLRVGGVLASGTTADLSAEVSGTSYEVLGGASSGVRIGGNGDLTIDSGSPGELIDTIRVSNSGLSALVPVHAAPDFSTVILTIPGVASAPPGSTTTVIASALRTNGQSGDFFEFGAVDLPGFSELVPTTATSADLRVTPTHLDFGLYVFRVFAVHSNSSSMPDQLIPTSSGALSEMTLRVETASGDVDADGAPDVTDVCPLEPDPMQLDRGGLGAGSTPDGIGDLCQCGDVNASGVIDSLDVSGLRNYLAGAASLPPAGLGLCTVFGSDGACNILMVTVLRRALAAPLLGPGVAQVCQAAGP